MVGVVRRAKPCKICKKTTYAMGDLCRDCIEGKTEIKRKKPKNATNALPGSKEKVKVMRERYSRNEELHHEDDAKYNSQFEDEEYVEMLLASLKDPEECNCSLDEVCKLCIEDGWGSFEYSNWLCTNMRNGR